MPAHIHCELFLPAVYLCHRVPPSCSVLNFRGLALTKIGNSLKQFLGSYVVNRVPTTRLVQWLSWVFKTEEIIGKKESQ